MKLQISSIDYCPACNNLLRTHTDLNFIDCINKLIEKIEGSHEANQLASHERN